MEKQPFFEVRNLRKNFGNLEVLRGVSLSMEEGEKAFVFEEIAARTPFGTNLRASEAYRRKIAPVLMARAVQGCKTEQKEAAK